MNPMLQVQELCAGYGKVPILRSVSFQIEDGEVVAILGPNGAGKSTLLKNISGLLLSNSGAIRWRGRDIRGLPPHRITRAGISFIPEGGRLFANMTVRENLLMGAYSRRENLRKGAMEQVFEIFPVLHSRSRQLAGTLSGGEKQMLAIGRGLIAGPSLLMLDEPSLGLAPTLVDGIYERLQLLRSRGLTVLLVEQNINYALELSNRGYVLENGQIVMEGSGAELASSEHVKRHYLGL